MIDEGNKTDHENQSEKTEHLTFTFEDSSDYGIEGNDDGSVQVDIAAKVSHKRKNLDQVTDTQKQATEERELRDRSIIGRPSRYEDLYIACTAAVVEEPQTYEEAVSGNNANEWCQAMKEEMNSLESNNTWSLVPTSEKQPIDCKWIYKIKYKSDGSIDTKQDCVLEDIHKKKV